MRSSRQKLRHQDKIESGKDVTTNHSALCVIHATDEVVRMQLFISSCERLVVARPVTGPQAEVVEISPSVANGLVSAKRKATDMHRKRGTAIITCVPDDVYVRRGVADNTPPHL